MNFIKSLFSTLSVRLAGVGLLLGGLFVAGCLPNLPSPSPSIAPRTGSPDILVVGDSQISFGAGAVHLDFFENLSRNCPINGAQRKRLAELKLNQVAAIGVRSSSLNNWVSRRDDEKAVICEVDKKFGVNAGAYGIANERKRKYVQIGQGADYQFCTSNRTPIQGIFHNGYYDPKLFVMAFLGNSAERWAESRSDALADVRDAMKQIPAKTPCIFMTTAPSYSTEINDLRQRAQANIKSAFNQVGRRCSFVEGITRETRAANANNARFFRTNDAGEVIDPLHPNTDAARKFFSIVSPQLCAATFKQIAQK